MRRVGHIYKLPFLWSTTCFTVGSWGLERQYVAMSYDISGGESPAFASFSKGPTKGMGLRYWHLLRRAAGQAWVGPGGSSGPDTHTAFLSGSYQACTWKPCDVEMHSGTWDPALVLGSSVRNLKWHKCHLLKCYQSASAYGFLVFTHSKPPIHVFLGDPFSWL